MTIAFLSPSISRSAGGIFEIERCLAAALEMAPNTIIEVFGIEDEYTIEDVPLWHPVQLRYFPYQGPANFRFSPRLNSALARSDFDLLHLHVLWMYTSLVSLRWTRRTGRPLIVTINGMLDGWALNNARWKKRLARLLYERANLQAAACLQVNTVNEWQAVRAYGLDTPVCIIPNGVDLPEIELDCEAPWKSTVKPGKKVVLFLGRVHPKKGLRQLIDAWAWAQRHSAKADTWELLIVGWDDGGHQAQLQQQVIHAGLSDSVQFLGPRFGAEKAAALQHADAFILPSFSEGLPMAVLEACGYRLPVLMTPACNLAEGFDLGAAIEIQPEPDSIANGLDVLFEMSDGERAAMGAKGRVFVEARFSWPRVAAEMREVYEWVLGGGPPPDSVRLS